MATAPDTKTAEISQFFQRNKQTAETFKNKMDLRNALFNIFKEVFPCKTNIFTLISCST